MGCLAEVIPLIALIQGQPFGASALLGGSFFFFLGGGGGG